MKKLLLSHNEHHTAIKMREKITRCMNLSQYNFKWETIPKRHIQQCLVYLVENYVKLKLMCEFVCKHTKIIIFLRIDIKTKYILS